MKVIVLLAAILLTVPAVLGEPSNKVQCDTNQKQGDKLAGCGSDYTITKDDDEKCGDDSTTPCPADIAATDNTDCNKCFRIVYARAKYDSQVSCATTCPALDRCVHIKVKGLTTESDTDKHSTSIGSHAFRRLCPHRCQLGHICVTDKSHCMSGAVLDDACPMATVTSGAEGTFTIHTEECDKTANKCSPAFRTGMVGALAAVVLGTLVASRV